MSTSVKTKLSDKHRRFVYWVYRYPNLDNKLHVKTVDMIKVYCQRIINDGYSDADRNDLNQMRELYIKEYLKKRIV
jgi:hypothetical protein